MQQQFVTCGDKVMMCLTAVVVGNIACQLTGRATAIYRYVNTDPKFPRENARYFGKEPILNSVERDRFYWETDLSIRRVLAIS